MEDSVELIASRKLVIMALEQCKDLDTLNLVYGLLVADNI